MCKGGFSNTVCGQCGERLRPGVRHRCPFASDPGPPSAQNACPTEIPGGAGAGWKFRIERTDGAPLDPAAVYVVLRVDGPGEKRTAARVVLMDYARRVQLIAPEESEEIGELIAECQIRAHGDPLAEGCPQCDRCGAKRSPSVPVCPFCDPAEDVDPLLFRH